MLDIMVEKVFLVLSTALIDFGECSEVAKSNGMMGRTTLMANITSMVARVIIHITLTVTTTTITTKTVVAIITTMVMEVVPISSIMEEIERNKSRKPLLYRERTFITIY